ncbi:MAG: cysteine desulfurase family protein [Solirubrobacterales bacterium]
MQSIYFDHAATTSLAPECLEAMMPYFKERYGNASATYRLGREAAEGIDQAREEVAELIGAASGEICFTAGGTEANNLAIIGAAMAGRNRGRHIVTSAIEHSSVLEACRWLERQGFRMTYLPVDELGRVEPQAILDAIEADTILISLMHANNEIGTIQPVEAAGRIARERGILFHTDAVQTVGRIPVDVDDIRCDLLSAASHKMYGPKGAGCLYVRRETKLEPVLMGGSQERGLRAGTENIAGIVGFGRAAVLAGKEMTADHWQLTRLRDHLMNGVLDAVGGVVLNGHRFERLPGNANFSFREVDGPTMLRRLDEHGFAVSSGSACHAASPKPSHVLKALGHDDDLARATLRVTLGRHNTVAEIDRLLDVLPEVIAECRERWPAQQRERSLTETSECPCEQDTAGSIRKES